MGSLSASASSNLSRTSLKEKVLLFFYLTDSLSEIYSDISYTLLGVNFTFCMKFTGEVMSGVVIINMIGLY